MNFPVDTAHPTRTQPAYFESLSLKIHKTLTDLAATTDNRERMKEACTFSDILGTISSLPDYTWNTFGSAYEGSTISGMQSDIDCVLLHQEFQIVEDRSAAPSGKSLLVIQDETTPPGYAKLQLLYDGEPVQENDLYKIKYEDYHLFITDKDQHGRIIVKLNLQRVLELSSEQLERHGPALSVEAGTSQLAKDIVNGLYCKDFPKCASEWLVRKRHYNWPPRCIMEACRNMGYILVSIGHPRSVEADSQYRLSLSYQERLLITQFTSEQLMCFILLKLIKKDVLSKRMQVESLTSYHMKTCMLYMVETTPAQLWKPENLLECLVMCLEKLAYWVGTGFCPNYFITDENMFERRIHGDVRKKLKDVMNVLLSEECRFINEIQTVPIRGVTIASVYSCNMALNNRLGLLADMAFYIMNCVRYLLKFGFETYDSLLERHTKKIEELRVTKTITVHTEEQTQRVLSLLLPYLEIHLLANKVSMAHRRNACPNEMLSLLSSPDWEKFGCNTDRYTGKLKHATLLYMSGYFEKAVEILLSIDDGAFSYAVCECDGKNRKEQEFELVQHRELQKAAEGLPNIEIEEFMKNVARPCVMFLPYERELVPIPLQYEMRRTANSFSMREGVVFVAMSDPTLFWYEWAVVDAKVLLRLVLYLNSRRLDRDTEADYYLNTIRALVQGVDIMPGTHSDTSMNILAWMYKDSGKPEAARHYFEKSLSLKPRHNAAELHLQDLDKEEEPPTVLYERDPKRGRQTMDPLGMIK